MPKVCEVFWAHEKNSRYDDNNLYCFVTGAETFCRFFSKERNL